MGRLAYAAETMALYDTLKTFTLRCAYHIDKFTFYKNIDTQGIAQFVFSLKTLKLDDFFLGSGTCFLKMTDFGLVRTLLRLVIETQL